MDASASVKIPIIPDDYIEHQKICDEYKRDEVENGKYWWHTAGIHPKYKD